MLEKNDKKHIVYVQSLLDRFLNGVISGEELDTLFNYYHQRYFDWENLNDNHISLFEELNEALSFYEPNPGIRKEHKSYFGDDKLKDIVLKIKKQLN